MQTDHIREEAELRVRLPDTGTGELIDENDKERETLLLFRRPRDRLAYYLLPLNNHFKIEMVKVDHLSSLTV